MRSSKDRRAAIGKPCPYCTRTMEQLDHPRLAPTRDHVEPQSKGGKTIVIACTQCNMIKADMTAEQWAGFMRSHPGWWKLSMHQLRLIRRKIGTPGLVAWRNDRREAKLRKQGSPPAKPVVVPVGLIWSDAQIERNKRRKGMGQHVVAITPELIAATIIEGPIYELTRLTLAPDSGSLRWPVDSGTREKAQAPRLSAGVFY
jgi:hypothetical protein